MSRLLALSVTLVVIAGGWTALWFYAAGEAEHTLDAWMAREQAQTRVWTCPNRSVTGYPFAIELSCSHPTFTGLALGQRATGGIGGLVGGASLAHPRSVSLALTPPFTYRTDDGATALSASWSAMTVDLLGLPSNVGTVAVQGTDLTVSGQFGPLGAQASRAQSAAATLVGVSTDGAPSIDVTVSLGGLAAPLLDQALGGEQPVDVTASGRVTQASVADAGTPAERIDRWRKSGGTITLSDLTLSRGPSRVAAGGSLRLDDAHRVEGTLDARFTGVEPILKRYGINPNVAAAGSLLTSLLGGGRRGGEPAQPGQIRMPIQLQGGRVAIGPVRTGIMLPPLY